MTRLRVVLSVLFFFLVVCVPERAHAQASLEKTTVAYRKVDGHSILADVYRPRDEKVRPVIVYIHGGALMMGNREALRNWTLLSLAEKYGFAIVAIDYRLAPETRLPAIISDVQAAFSWIAGDGAKQFHLDPDRMVVCGESAGGYIALVTGYRVSPKPKAVVALFGYGELDADWYNKPNPYPAYNTVKITPEEANKQTDGTVISDGSARKGSGGIIYRYYRQNGLWTQEVSGFPVDSLSREVEPYEPVHHVTRDFPPTFLMHGTMDTDVPFEQSEKMAEQFRKNGVPYILIPIQKADHAFVGGDPTSIAAGYHSMQEFLLKYLEAK